MKKPERSFVIEVGQSALLGVSPESLLSVRLINSRTGKDTTAYSASLEWFTRRWLANSNEDIPPASHAASF